MIGRGASVLLLSYGALARHVLRLCYMIPVHTHGREPLRPRKQSTRC
jgi:hypothetical protein